MKKKLMRYVLGMIIAALVFAPIVLTATGVLPYRVYVVQTGSMIPAIPPESLVVVRVGKYDVGQVISFYKGNAVVTHRLLAVNDDGSLTTKGDANATADASTISRSDVIGGVVAAPSKLGFWVVYFKNPLVILAIVLCFAGMWLLAPEPDAPAPEPSSLVQVT